MRKILIMAVLFLTACSQSRVARPDPAALKRADLDFARATAERGLEGFSAFLAEDVLSIRPNSPVVKGREALAGRWAALLNDPDRSIKWEPLEAVISDDGRMGFTVGAYEIIRSGSSGKPAASTGKYVTIWRKQADGSWKVAYDSGVQDAPSAKPQP